MDYKYIEQLLDRYFLAETTVQEEQILKSFFAQTTEQLPEQLSRYAALFTALGDMPQLGDDFDERLLAMTEGTPAVNAAATTGKQGVVKARTIRLTERLRPLFKAVAVVAIVLTLGNAINQSLSKSESARAGSDEYATAKDGGTDIGIAYDQGGDTVRLAKDNIPAATIIDTLTGAGVD